METAEILISRLRPVLAAAVEASSPNSPNTSGASAGAAAPLGPADPAGPVLLHAEVLHQLCTVDGLMELLDWSRQGLGADPLACMWLGSLRWYRLITGSYPEGAPQPPARTLDQQLQQLLGSGSLTARPGSAATSLRGLSHGQLAYPSAPAQPESTDTTALLRAVPVGLVPYIDASMRRDWARQTIALTHGHPDLMQKAETLADLVHLLASGAPSDALSETAAQRRGEVIAGIDGDVAAIVDRQLLAAAGAVPAAAASDVGGSASVRTTAAPGGSGIAGITGREARGVYDVIEELAQHWEEVTRAR